MGKGNVSFQFANHDKGNFLIVNKEIFTLKDENGNPLVSSEAKILFLTLMSISGIDEWELSPLGLAKILKWNKNTVIKYMKELMELGYLKRNELKFHKTTYEVFETINQELWDTKNLDTNFSCTKNTYPKFSDTIKSDTKFSDTKNSPQYSIHEYSIQNNKEHNKIENINNRNVGINSHIDQSSFSSNNLNLNNTCNHDYYGTCSHDSTTTSTFSNKINKHEVNMAKNFVASDTNLNNSYGKQKSKKTIKGIKNDGNPTKNKEELNTEKSKVSVSEMLKNEENAKPLNEQTVEEQVLAKANQVNLETESMLYEIKAKTAVRKNTKNSRITKIFNIIEKEETVLQESLKNFFSYVIEIGKPVLEENYRSFRRKLDSLSSDDATKIAIIEQSLSNCWTDIYPLKDYDKFKKDSKPINSVKIEDKPTERSKFVLDENGNPKTV